MTKLIRDKDRVKDFVFHASTDGDPYQNFDNIIIPIPIFENQMIQQTFKNLHSLSVKNDESVFKPFLDEFAAHSDREGIEDALRTERDQIGGIISDEIARYFAIEVNSSADQTTWPANFDARLGTKGYKKIRRANSQMLIEARQNFEHNSQILERLVSKVEPEEDSDDDDQDTEERKYLSSKLRVEEVDKWLGSSADKRTYHIFKKEMNAYFQCTAFPKSMHGAVLLNRIDMKVQENFDVNRNLWIAAETAKAITDKREPKLNPPINEVYEWLDELENVKIQQGNAYAEFNTTSQQLHHQGGYNKYTTIMLSAIASLTEEGSMTISNGLAKKQYIDNLNPALRDKLSYVRTMPDGIYQSQNRNWGINKSCTPNCTRALFNARIWCN